MRKSRWKHIFHANVLCILPIVIDSGRFKNLLCRFCCTSVLEDSNILVPRSCRGWIMKKESRWH